MRRRGDGGCCRVVDFCSGGGHLGILLAHLLPEAQVLLVENNENSLRRAADRITEMGIRKTPLFPIPCITINSFFYPPTPPANRTFQLPPVPVQPVLLPRRLRRRRLPARVRHRHRPGGLRLPPRRRRLRLLPLLLRVRQGGGGEGEGRDEVPEE